MPAARHLFVTFISSLLCLLAAAATAHAHEFWISPQEYVLDGGASIAADLRIGQNFGGSSFPFVADRFVRFDLVQGDRVVPVEGRAGDLPALNMAPPGPGLWIVVHESTDSIVNWRDWDIFKSFVEHKALAGVLESHLARGLPQTGFKERYRRFAKALVAVGGAAGSDRIVGLRTEIVAGANPYADDMSKGLPVQVLFEGAPRAGAQIEIFDRGPDYQVTTSRIRLDAEGRAVIPVERGHEYLLDSVKMLELPAADPLGEPVYESLWAALTFYVP